jgi:hypothetical protein
VICGGGCLRDAGHTGACSGEFFGARDRESVTAPIPSEDEINAARSKRISDRAARTLASLRDRARADLAWHKTNDDRQLVDDLDEVIRACGRDPETIGRLL